MIWMAIFLQVMVPVLLIYLSGFLLQKALKFWLYFSDNIGYYVSIAGLGLNNCENTSL